MQGDINARWQGTGGTCSKTWAFLSPLMNGKGTDNIFTCHCSKKPTTQFGKMLWGWLNWMVRPQPAKQNWPVLTNCSQDICLHSGNLKCLGIIRGSSRSNILTCGEVNTCHKAQVSKAAMTYPKTQKLENKNDVLLDSSHFFWHRRYQRLGSLRCSGWCQPPKRLELLLASHKYIKHIHLHTCESLTYAHVCVTSTFTVYCIWGPGSLFPI